MRSFRMIRRELDKRKHALEIIIFIACFLFREIPFRKTTIFFMMKVY